MASTVRFSCLECIILIETPRTVKIPFASNKHAEIAKKVIEVDQELQAHQVKRDLVVEDATLIVYVQIFRVLITQIVYQFFHDANHPTS